MKWNCNACGAKVKGNACPNCGAVLSDPATTPATEKMHRALRSVPFVLAVIFFTLALLLNIAVGLMTQKSLSAAEVNEAIAAVEKETGITLPDNVLAAVNRAVERTRTDVSDVVSANLFSVLACVGLWLLVGTGFRSGRIGKAGAVILKIITVFELVCLCLGMAVIAALAVFLVFGQNVLLKLVADLGVWDAVVQAIRDVMSMPYYNAVVWAIAGGLLLSLLIGLFFLIGAIKTENEVIRVSRFGQGRKVSLFLCIMLIIGAAGCLTGGVSSVLSLKLWGAGALLNGLYMLLFAITILRYRKWSREVLWSDVHPEAVDRAIAAIPTELGTDELLDTANLGAPDAATQVAPPTEPEQPAESEEPVEPDVPEPPKPSDRSDQVDQFMASIRSTSDAESAAPATTVCPNCGAVMQGKVFFCEECGQVL